MERKRDKSEKQKKLMVKKPVLLAHIWKKARASILNPFHQIGYISSIQTSYTQRSKLKTFWEMIVIPFLIPGVVPYSLSHACIKLVNYSLFFWLPLYLTQYLKFSSDLSALLSTMYDVGGIIGGILSTLLSTDLTDTAVGGLTDFLLRRFKIDRSPTLLLMCLLSVGSLYIYHAYGGVSIIVNVVLMTLAGIFIGGAANIIASAVAADLGQQVVRTLNQTWTDRSKGKQRIARHRNWHHRRCGKYRCGCWAITLAAISNNYGWSAFFYFLMVSLVMYWV